MLSLKFWIFCPTSFVLGGYRLQCMVHRCRRRQMFWGAKEFCPNFPKFARENLGHYLWVHLHKQTGFWNNLQKRSSCDPANTGRHLFQSKPRWVPFSNQTTFGAILFPIFRDFAKVFTHFAQLSRDFAQIFTTSKPQGCTSTTCNPDTYTTSVVLQDEFLWNSHLF